MRSVATPLWSRTVSCATLRARHRDGAVRKLELSGEADIATLDMLKRELARLCVVHRDDAVVDLSALVFCDVASAHLLLTARRTVPVRLTGATGSVRRVLDLVNELHLQRLPSYQFLDRAPALVGVSVWW